ARHNLVRTRLEARHPLPRISRPARFAELAVVDDVDAGRDLALDDVLDAGLEHRAIVRVSAGFPVLRNRLEQRLGTDQTADMGGEDTVLAALHGSSSSAAAARWIATRLPS